MLVYGPITKVRLHEQESTHKEWWFDNWSTTEPFGVRVSHRSWSDFLAESYNNGQSHYNEYGRDVGSDFLVFRKYYSENSPSGEFGPSEDVGDQRADHVSGPFFVQADFDDANFPTVIPSSKLLLRAYGATAISRCLPTNPVSSLGTGLGEIIVDGLPGWGMADWRNKTSAARSAGSNYLNYDFGWAPLVREVRSFCHAVKNAESILKRYVRNSGKPITASYEFPPETDFVVTDGYSPRGASPGYGYLNIWREPFGELQITDTISTRKWFKGTFTYYLPPNIGHGISGYEPLANKLLGTRLTPETLWDLSPWTWAADWFANYGDVIHNVVAFQNDGLVLERGFMMEHKFTETTYRIRGLSTWTGGDMTLTRTWRTDSKRRVAASPYGFGLTFDGFSDRQKATIAALGLTKQGRTYS